MDLSNKPKKKWYQKTTGIIVLLILFFPVGIYLMWKYTNWNKKVKWGITIFFIIFFLFNSQINKTIGRSNSNKPQTAKFECIGPDGKKIGLSQSACKEFNDKWKSGGQATSPETQAQKQEPTKVPVKITNTSAPIQTKQTDNQNTSPISNETVSQKNAVRKAKSYLSYTAFSHDGLVAQLEYEKFSHENAVYGADNSGANWNEQAAKKAKSYMDMSAYSRDGLIEQLKYEKFTQEQAEYGANAVGL